MRSLRSRVCLQLASALATLANVPPVWVIWWRKGSPCSYDHAAIHTYPFPLPFNPSPIKPPSTIPLAPRGSQGRLGQSGKGALCAPLSCLSPTRLRNDICYRLISIGSIHALATLASARWLYALATLASVPPVWSATARAAPPFRNGNCSPARSVATGLGREGGLATPSPLRVA